VRSGRLQSSLSRVSWRDSVLINAPGLNRQVEVFTAGFLRDALMGTTLARQDRARAEIAFALQRSDSNDNGFASFVCLPGIDWRMRRAGASPEVGAAGWRGS
jgi:hypothetical protein